MPECKRVTVPFLPKSLPSENKILPQTLQCCCRTTELKWSNLWWRQQNTVSWHLVSFITAKWFSYKDVEDRSYKWKTDPVSLVKGGQRALLDNHTLVRKANWVLHMRRKEQAREDKQGIRFICSELLQAAFPQTWSRRLTKKNNLRIKSWKITSTLRKTSNHQYLKKKACLQRWERTCLVWNLEYLKYIYIVKPSVSKSSRKIKGGFAQLNQWGFA